MRATLLAVGVWFLSAQFGFTQTPPEAAKPVTISPEALKVELGRKLFFDKRMSADGSTSCASCHDPSRGWADGRTVAVGMARQLVGTRNSPTIIGAAYQTRQFWDARADSLNDQALQPLTNPIEMGNQSRQQVANRLNSINGYPQLFQAAFNGQTATPANMAQAIEAFERTVQSFNAPIDRYLAGDTSVLTAGAERGFQIFQAASCMTCHEPPMFRDGAVHNTGISFRFRTGDQGRGGLSNTPDSEIRAFKTPTLREIAKTAPYTHAGSVATLAGMVDHYNRGAARNDGLRDARLDPRVRPLGLNAQQQQDLVQFLSEAFVSPDYPYISPPVLP